MLVHELLSCYWFRQVGRVAIEQPCRIVDKIRIGVVPRSTKARSSASKTGWGFSTACVRCFPRSATAERIHRSRQPHPPLGPRDPSAAQREARNWGFARFPYPHKGARICLDAKLSRRRLSLRFSVPRCSRPVAPSPAAEAAPAVPVVPEARER